jgi:hypothetical protein
MHTCVRVYIDTQTYFRKVRKHVSQEGNTNLKLRRIHLYSNNRVLQQLIQQNYLRAVKISNSEGLKNGV